MDDRPRQAPVPRDRFAGFAAKLLATLFFSLSFSAFANEPALEWLRARFSVVGLAGKAGDLVTPFQQASEALEALYAAGATRPELARIGAGLYLDDPAGADTEYLARGIIAGTRLVENASVLTAHLLSRQGSEGGFAPLPGYGSTLLDTAFALRALATAGLGDRAESQSAATYLTARQEHDGGWSEAGNGANPHLTALVSQALWSVRNSTSTAIPVQRAAALLLAQRDSDGLWDETFAGAIALLAVLPTLNTLGTVASSIDALGSRQSANGSWAESVYTTALAARVLATTALPVPNPDLAVLRGAVVDGVTGEALSGASVALASDQTQIVLTRGDGAFELVGLEPSREFSLSVRHRGFAPLSFALVLNRGQLIDLGDLPMLRDSASPHGSVRGVVSGALGGEPLSNVVVSLSEAGLSVVTDSEGRFRIDGVSAGDWTAIAALDGYRTASAVLEVIAGGTILFSPSLQPVNSGGFALAGVVRDGLSGSPVAGASVTLEGAGGAQGTTDATGYIELDRTSTGEVTLIVEALGYETFTDTLHVTDSETTIFRVTLYPQGATPTDAYTAGIAGVVLSPHGGEPLRDVLVVVSYGASHETVRTGLDGRFRIMGLSSGTARLLIGGEGHEVLRYSVALAPGRVIDLGVLKLPPQNVVALLPDLQVVASEPWRIDWDPGDGQAEGAVTALVTNLGYGNAMAGVEVTAFYDADLDGGFDPALDSVLGVSLSAETLAPLEQLEIGVPVRGTLPFRDAPVLFEVDSQGHVPEADENNNLSALACRPKPLLGDDFDDGVADGWTQIPNQIGEVSDWDVADGVYRVERGGGTWVGDRAWADYSLRVRVRVAESSRNDAGVLFRYQDPLNWYQFRFRDGLARIIARIDGEVFADLVESPVSMQADRWYTWRADVSGDKVQVYVDDLPVLTYRGLVLERGAVGFMNDGVTTYHDDLLVVPIVPSTGLADLTVSRPALLDKGTDRPPGVRVRVGNGGNGYSPAGVELGFYAGEGVLPQSLLQSVALDGVAPGAYSDIELPAIGLDDGESLSVVANPERGFAECSFENNLASTAFYAPEVSGNVTVADVDGPFAAGQHVPLTVTVSNPGRFLGAYSLAVTVEDLRGGTAAELAEDVPLVLAGGEAQNLAFAWSSAGFLEGDYEVQVVLRNRDGKVLDREVQRFGLGAARGAGGLLFVRASTDRRHYGLGDAVDVGVLVGNLTSARLVPRVLLQVQVEDSSSTRIFEQSFDLGALPPGSQIEQGAQVSLGSVRPGSITVSVRALEAETAAFLGADTVEVEVSSRPLRLVSGHVSLGTPVLSEDQEQTCVVQVSDQYSGPVLPLRIRVSVLDLADGRPVWQKDDEIAIGGGEIVETDREISVDKSVRGVYACVLQAGAYGEWRTLDFATFVVAPLGTVVSEPEPTAGEPRDDDSDDAVVPEHADSHGDDASEIDEHETEATLEDTGQGAAAERAHAVPAMSSVSLAILVLLLGLFGSRRLGSVQLSFLR